MERFATASVFHSSAWLTALANTYRFTLVALTTSAPADELRNAVVFGEVRSRLTGARLVSLPFSDHCEPLVSSSDALQAICDEIATLRAKRGWRYVEMRPVSATTPPRGFAPSSTYHLHRLDLRPGAEALFRRFHRDSIQRRVRHAEKEGLTSREGRTDELIGDLYHLLDLTRRRHRAPLQPLRWFQNLAECFGDRLSVRVAYSGRTPAAAILTISHARTTVYKYGGSDVRLNSLGGTPWLFWHAIREAAERGDVEFDFGRTDVDNPGLTTFKTRWGAQPCGLTYWRSPASTASPSGTGRTVGLARRAISVLPGPVRRAVGGILYPHIG